MAMPSGKFSDLFDTGVLITGGASGIGAALAEGFAIQGAKVAILDIDDTAAEATVDRIARIARHRPLYAHVDMRDVAEMRTAIDRLAGELGGIGVLVNNVARDDRHDFDTLSLDAWDGNLAVNLRPTFFASQAAVPHMRAAGGGSIINFSSVAFMMNLPDMPAYLTAKAGIIGLTKGLAGKLGTDGIRVNAILPGMVLTERQKQLWVSEDAASAHRDRQALKFSLTAEDMVGPCLFLASDCSAAITAQSLIVDGGYF